MVSKEEVHRKDQVKHTRRLPCWNSCWRLPHSSLFFLPSLRWPGDTAVLLGHPLLFQTQVQEGAGTGRPTWNRCLEEMDAVAAIPDQPLPRFWCVCHVLSSRYFFYFFTVFILSWWYSAILQENSKKEKLFFPPSGCKTLLLQGKNDDIGDYITV